MRTTYNTKPLRHIRPFLDVQTANVIACSTIGSRLDYCNSLPAGVKSHNIAQMQNNAVKVVCCATGNTIPKPLLKQ